MGGFDSSGIYGCDSYYGSPDVWVTKWFMNSFDTAVYDMLNDRQIALLRRAQEYLDANKAENEHG